MHLVALVAGRKVVLRLVSAVPGRAERIVHDVCEFDGGEVVFLKKRKDGPDPPAGLLSDAERLCLSAMPRDYNPVRIAEVLSDPFWQYVLDHMRAAHVMES